MKNSKLIIALDAMGGDKAPSIVVEGASIALKNDKDIFFKIFGDEAKILPFVKKFRNLKGNYEIIHTDSFISNEEKPAVALKQGRQSSMRLAINSVKSKEADAIVSAGNTGALMAMSKFVLNTMKGIDRPAIVTYVPTRKSDCVLLDLGANSDSSPEQLLQFAIMGDAFAKSVLNLDSPRIGLLNIGSENLKGNKLIQEASELISQSSLLNYLGFAEGHDIFKGNFDVIVTDGFTGNVTLKVIEGTVGFIKYKISNIFKISPLSYIGLFFLLLFSFFGIRKVGKQIDPRRYNGAMLVGLDGISVKSHGGADKIAFANAIAVAKKLSVAKINDKIRFQLEQTYQ